MLGAPTATASARIGAIVRISDATRRFPAVRRLPPRVLTSGSFLDLARAIPSIGLPDVSGSLGSLAHRRIDLSGPDCGREPRGHTARGGGSRKA